MGRFRSYNPGKDDRWGVRGSAPYNPPNVEAFGGQLAEANYQHRMGEGQGEMLPWSRYPTPVQGMTAAERAEAELVSTNYPGVSEIRSTGSGVKWWHLRATPNQVRNARLLPAIEPTAAVVAAGE